MKLDVQAFALVGGIICNIGLFLLTWQIIFFEGTTSEPTFIGMLYHGYTVSPTGSVIGFAWALVDGSIGGAIFAWLYNFISTRTLRSQS